MESEPDGVGVSSPAHRFISDSDHKLQSQVILAEVIDIDDDDDDGSPDVMILDEMFNGKKKGKAIEEHSQHLATESAPGYIFCPSDGSTSGSPKPILTDDSNSDMIDNHEIFDISDDITDFEYPHLQDYFDNVEFPSGVEASIPSLLDSARRRRKIENRSDSLGTRNQKNLNALLSWTSDSAGINKNLSPTNSSSVQGALNSMNHASEAHISSRHSFLESGIITKRSSTSQLGGSSMYLTTPQKQEMQVTSSKFYKAEILFSDQPSHSRHYIPFDVKNQGGSMNPIYKSPVVTSALDPHDAVGPSMSWSTPNFVDWSSNQTSDSGFYKSLCAAQNLHEESAARTLEHVDVENFLKKYENFKQFDTVEGHSDHHYASIGSSDKPNSKNWAKKIQEEWRILENDLPDTIFVRVYESRMDLLRAAIIGAEGTPYHDGLFFFDIFFPSGYPDEPPKVYYHSGGLRLNPNLYNCGKVCLSLLGTWHGNKNENWIPGVSTVLQVLVSIQALILNRKPFFNEPLYARLSNSASGEIQSHEYNEKTFILSLKTMVYTMKKPPKHFEDFVFGHFYKHAHDILVACEAYEDGAQVGCLVKSGIQDVDEGDKSCSKSFKSSLPGCVNVLLKEFQRIGVKDIGRYQILAKLEC